MMNDLKRTYIYESPDGGDTVYRRELGSDPINRELHSISDRKRSLMDELKESKLWGDIHRSAKTDPVLQDMLDRIVVYHRLKSQP